MNTSASLLLIEDDNEIREMLCSFLTDNAYAVETAANGMDGLRMALDKGYDLILLDNEIIMKATKIPDQPVFRLTKAKVIERLVTGVGLVMDPSFDELYLSMPYLTDRQSEVYEENYWN